MREVRRIEFLFGPQVQHQHLAGPGPFQDGLAIHALQVIAVLDQRGEGHLQFHQAFLGLFAQRHPEVGHAGAGEPVDHVLAFLAVFHQPRQPKLLEVRAGQLDADVGLRCQQLDGLLALAQEFDQFESLGTGHRLGDAGNLFVEVGLGGIHAYSLTNIRMFATPDTGGGRAVGQERPLVRYGGFPTGRDRVCG
jgi:hypothetical protein